MIASTYTLHHHATQLIFCVPGPIVADGNLAAQADRAFMVLRALNIAVDGHPDGSCQQLVVFNPDNDHE